MNRHLELSKHYLLWHCLRLLLASLQSPQQAVSNKNVVSLFGTTPWREHVIHSVVLRIISSLQAILKVIYNIWHSAVKEWHNKYKHSVVKLTRNINVTDSCALQFISIYNTPHITQCRGKCRRRISHVVNGTATLQ